MLNLAKSFVTTMLSLIIGFLSFLKGPILTVAGVAILILALSSPAEAAVLKCALSNCPPLDGMIWERKLSIILLLIGSLITAYLVLDNKGE